MATLRMASGKWGGIGVDLVALESRRLFQICAQISEIVVWPPPTPTEPQMMGGLATGYTQRAGGTYGCGGRTLGTIHFSHY